MSACLIVLFICFTTHVNNKKEISFVLFCFVWTFHIYYPKIIRFYSHGQLKSSPKILLSGRWKHWIFLWDQYDYFSNSVALYFSLIFCVKYGCGILVFQYKSFELKNSHVLMKECYWQDALNWCSSWSVYWDSNMMYIPQPLTIWHFY